MERLEIFKHLLVEKSSLIKCIFITLITQTIITALVFIIFYNNKDISSVFLKKYNVFYAILYFVFSLLLIKNMLSSKLSFNLRMLLFILFSAFNGYFMGIVLHYVSKDVIVSALLSTLAIFTFFLVMGFFIVYMNIDIGWLGIYLFFGLLSLIIFKIVVSLIPPNDKHETRNKTRIFVIASMMIFALYILYDTNNILLKYRNSDVDCIRGALEYYLDILNLYNTTTKVYSK